MNFDKHGQNMIKVKKRSPVTDVIGLLSFFESIINTVDNKYQPYLNL